MRMCRARGSGVKLQHDTWVLIRPLVPCLDAEQMELLSAFKKQLKLIDVLKRQKVSRPSVETFC